MGQALKPKYLSSRHQRVLLLHHRGLKRPQIAKETGYGITRISQVINSEPGREHLEQLRADERAVVTAEGLERVRAVLDAEAMPSLRKLASLMENSESERVQLSAANSLLDRTVPRKVQQSPPPAQFIVPEDMVERLVKVLEETARPDAAYDAAHPEDIEDAETVDRSSKLKQR